MLAAAHSAVLVGLAAHPVRVEVEAGRGIPSFELVGLAEAAVKESRVRVKSALAGVGIDLSEYRVIVNLAPADVKKRGSAFDHAIAVGAMTSLGALPEDALGETLFLGELSLAGTFLPLRGVVAHLTSARERGVPRAIVPRANEEEASLVEGIDVYVASSLAEVVAFLRGEGLLARPRRGRPPEMVAPIDDLAEVRGQMEARRALEVAAAGGHNLLFLGNPGAGKTMLARRLPGILPPLTPDEALEVIAIHSVAGLLGDKRELGVRPFRAPHHTVTEVALVGGGDRIRPGEVSLAHHGVLFLDELGEFQQRAIEALRQPLEEGFVTVCRATDVAVFPARPMLVAATNPCPCGRQGDGTSRCICNRQKVAAYRARLSGPILDRIDVQCGVRPVDVMSLHEGGAGEPSSAVRARVERARAVQLERRRRGEVRAFCNARLSAAELARVCALDAAGAHRIKEAIAKLGLSARAYSKILRVARTFADLEGSDAIRPPHVDEAIGLRKLDKDPLAAPDAIAARV